MIKTIGYFRAPVKELRELMFADTFYKEESGRINDVFFHQRFSYQINEELQGNASKAFQKYNQWLSLKTGISADRFSSSLIAHKEVSAHTDGIQSYDILPTCFLYVAYAGNDFLVFENNKVKPYKNGLLLSFNQTNTHGVIRREGKEYYGTRRPAVIIVTDVQRQQL